MRNLKKFLALVLAMMMACSLVVTGSAAKWNSSAGTFDDQSGVTPAFEEGVAVVTGMKIFKGDAGTKDFRPAASIKRSEVAAIVYRLVTGDVTDSSAYLYTHVAPFTDVNPTDWFAGYVGYLWNAEIIKGSNTERTEFNPYGEVTGYEALAMVLRALGYDANDEFTGAGWQIRVGQYANKAELLTNVNTTNYGAGHLNAAARRDTVAEIIFQAANADLVIYTPAFGYETTRVQAGTNVTVNTLGWTNFGLTGRTGIVVGNQATGESVTKMGFGTNGGQYFYGGANLTKSNNPAASGQVSNFDHDTPLGQFGHANRVWYDGNNNSGGAGKFHTYAWIDKATKADVVYVGEGPDDTNNINSVVYDKAESLGYSLTGVKDLLFGSDKYDRMGPLMDTLDGYAGADGVEVEERTDVESDEIHMYSLISNSLNGKLDVVISLNAEVAAIFDTNTTDTTNTIVLLGGEHGRKVVASDTTGRVGAEIAVDRLTADSVKTLGADVTSWVVDGTADITADQNFESHYQTIAVKEGATGTVSTIDAEGTVTLSDGKQIKKSYLCPVIRGVNFTPADEDLTLNAGVAYTFMVDQWGRYLGIDTDPGYTFIYGTFADHDYSGVGSGEMKYLVYGVGPDGGKITGHPLTMLQEGSDAVFAPMSGAQFNEIEVARRDYGTTAVGNQVAAGVYRAGWITADGKWLVNDESGTVAGGGFKPYRNTVTKGTSNDWADDDDWTITDTDAARGFLDLNGDGTLLITNSTVFYVVSGTGTATLNVKTYNGMTGFLDGATEVQIEATYKDGNVGDDSYDVAYMTTVDTYNSVGELPQNRMITKVFVYENAVRRNSTSTLFYVHDNSATGLQIAGYEGEYEQYEMWQGSTKTNVFLTARPDADTFYTMKKSATLNGIDVYVAEEVAEATYPNRGICLADEKIDYFASNDTSTARIGRVDVLETVYGVKDAVVVDLTKLSSMHSNGGCGNDHDAHNEIKSVRDLFNAISVGYDVGVSIVNTSSNVSLIYVVHVDDETLGRT